MTSLQWALLIIAVALTLGVVGVNVFQSRKSRARIASSREGQSFSQPKPNTDTSDGLDGADFAPLSQNFAGELSINERNEPVLERFNLPDEAAPTHSAKVAGDDGSGHRQATTASQNLPTKQDQVVSAPVGDAWLMRSYGLHTSADCIIEILFDGDDLPAARLLQLTQATRRVGSKPVLFEGQSLLNDWEPIVAGERFYGLRGGVLLANRNGPLNAMEFSDFVSLMQALADLLERPIRVPDLPTTLNRARALDAQCAELDAQIGLSVVCPQPLSTHDLSQVATEMGLAERGNNRFAALGEFGEVLFSLALGDAQHRLTFLLDVPRAPAATQPWDMMVDCAQRCAVRYGAQLVDDADKPLSDQALARIGGQLGQRYQRLADATFVAGSPVALRLFN